MNKLKTKIQNNKKTALASANGFAFQAYDFLCSFLELINVSSNELLQASYEDNQDYSLELSSKVICYQIKKVNSNISPGLFCKQINKFWNEIKDVNKDVRCCYRSTEKVKSEPLMKILEIWSKKAYSDSDIEHIQQFLLENNNIIDKSIIEFVKNDKSLKIATRDSIVTRMNWCFDHDKTLEVVVGEAKRFLDEYIKKRDKFKNNISVDNLFSQLKNRFDIKIDEEVKKKKHLIKLTALDINLWCDEILRNEINAKEKPETSFETKKSFKTNCEFIPDNTRQKSGIFDAEEELLKKTKISLITATEIKEIVENISSNLKNNTDSSRNLFDMQKAIKDVIFVKYDKSLDELKKLDPSNYILEECINLVNYNKFDKNKFWILLDSLIHMKKTI